jgi:hypothetical protein
MQFRCKERSLHEVGKEGRTIGPKTLTLAFAKAKPGGEGKKTASAKAAMQRKKQYAVGTFGNC